MSVRCSPDWIECQIALAGAAWGQCAAGGIPAGPRYDSCEQHRREQAYDHALADAEREARRAPVAGCKGTQRRLVGTFARFAAAALGLDEPAIDLLTHGFLPAGSALAQWAHRFDPALSHADIAQACRNGWTACGLQPLLGERMQMTPAILGYSLLYPYTDNYLDERLIEWSQKLEFSKRFRARLQGHELAPLDPHEANAWQMVSVIEHQFAGSRYPCVFESLLAIHAAQEESVAQLRGGDPLADPEILRVSCYKGGTSVLADAYLVRGSLTPAESEFAFAWGVLLQLGDDLQDVQEDLRRGSRTLFTAALDRGEPLDALVIQLLRFSEWAGSQMLGLQHGDESFRNLLRMSWRSLILMAVAYAPQFFTSTFLAELEPGSPFRFEFLRRRRERLRGNAGLFERLFGQVLQEQPEDAGLSAAMAHPSLSGFDAARPA